jgi:hypothetical protein
LARSSKRKNRRVISAFLFLLAAGSISIAVTKIRQDQIFIGVQFGAWAFLPLTLLLGFTLPVQCRVMTTRGTACGNEAYGLLFGCNKAAGHWFNKFKARLYWQSNAQTPIRHAKPSPDVAVMYNVTAGQAPLKVTIDDTVLSRCGVWAGIVSAVATVAALIVTLLPH